MADATSLGNLAEATLRLLAECGLPSPLYLESEAELEARCKMRIHPSPAPLAKRGAACAGRTSGASSTLSLLLC